MEDRTSSGETTHDLLLTLAGRVDDDLLSRARELVAVGEDPRAVELVTASLVASRAVLPERVRAALVVAARAARIDLDPEAVLPPSRPEDGTEHRFAEPPDDDPVAGALLGLPARSIAGCRVLLTRRRTPAGSAPGPLPHPVVLVQAPPAGRPVEVLAYQVAVALERAGADASVEVLTAGAEIPEYHAAALRRAVPVLAEDDVAPALAERPRRPDPAPEPAPASEPEPLLEPQAEALPEPLLAPEPEPEPEPVPESRPMHELRPVPPRLGLPTGSLFEPQRHAGEPPEGPLPTARHADRAEPEPSAPERPRPERPRPEPERPAAVVDAAEDDGADPGATTAMPTTAPGPARRPSPPAEPPPVRPAPRPIPTPTGRIRRPTVTPISRTAVPNPIPLSRRSGAVPIVRPLTPVEPEPADERASQPPPPEGPPARNRSAAEATSAFDSLRRPHPLSDPRTDPRPDPQVEAQGDPLNSPLRGPLDEPLMAPLPEPAVQEDDPLGVSGRLPVEDRPPPPGTADDDDWASDWFSGAWALSPSALDGPATERPRPAEPEPVAEEPPPQAEPEPEPPAPRPTPRRGPPRHRYADEGAQPPAEPVPPRREPEPAPAPEQDDESLGLRADSVARLSDADRQLLARLQAELLEGRKPRVTRRAGIGPGPGNNGSGTNGSHRTRPPDLAG